MSVKNIVSAIPISTIDSATLDGSFVSFTPLPHACFLIRITNGSTSPLTISFDGGETEHDFLPPITDGYSVLEIQAQTNSQPNNLIANFPMGMVIAVLGEAGTGDVTLAGYYQPKGI
jgi:hypothetical protein